MKLAISFSILKQTKKIFKVRQKKLAVILTLVGWGWLSLFVLCWRNKFILAIIRWNWLTK